MRPSRRSSRPRSRCDGRVAGHERLGAFEGRERFLEAASLLEGAAQVEENARQDRARRVGKKGLRGQLDRRAEDRSHAPRDGLRVVELAAVEGIQVLPVGQIRASHDEMAGQADAARARGPRAARPRSRRSKA